MLIRKTPSSIIIAKSGVISNSSVSCESHEDEGENGNQAERSSMTMSCSAFCSQDCLIKSYLEAASQAHARQQPEKNNIGRRNHANDLLMLHPGNPKKKMETGGKGARGQLPSNQTYLSVYPGRKRVVSRFTLNSCSSSSSTSSSSS
jgi:hypothetical protein